MTTTSRAYARALASAAALMLALPALPGHAASSDNARVIASVPFRGGTDLDFAGDLAFVGSWDDDDGGLYVVDVSSPSKPAVLGRFPCAGNQNDVGALGNGYVVMGMHSSGSSPGCQPVNRGGLRIVDVRDPAAPVQVAWQPIPSGGVHTLTVVGRTGYVYANPGGLSTRAAGQTTTIVDVSDPAKPFVAGSFRPPHSLGCHDVNVNADATRAYCAGSNVTQIWDITDPLKPVVISEIFNPAIFFAHGAVPSDDGDTLVIADEAFGAHVCDPTGRNPTGAFWFYDISDERLPVLRGWISQTGLAMPALIFTAWCTAHNFNMVPGRDVMVASAYSGGTSVIDFSDPTLPQVIAWVRPDAADTWSSYYYRGHVFTGDLGRGFDVIEVDDLAS